MTGTQGRSDALDPLSADHRAITQPGAAGEAALLDEVEIPSQRMSRSDRRVSQ